MNDELWNTYAGCWSAASTDARGATLAQVAADDVAYRDPHAEVRGRDALSAYMEQFQRGFPGHTFRIERVDAHHARSLARWALVDARGERVQRGISSAVHDADGRLRDITGFFPA